MNGTKPFFKSLGVMGPALGGVVAVFNNLVFGHTVVEETDVTQLVNAVNTVWTISTGIIGRIRASRQIA